MNRNEFNGFISGINLPGPGDLDELRELTSLFPWFHSAHMLFLRGLKENNDIRFDSQLRVSALSVADREVLYHYLFLDPADVADASGEWDVTKPAFAESPVDGVTPVVIPATGVTPVSMEVQITDDVPVPDEVSGADEVPVTEEVPVSEETIGAEEVPGAGEVTVAEDVTVTDETPGADEIPVTEEVPVPEEAPGTAEVPVSEETIGAEEVHGAGEAPVADEISVPAEAPVTDDIHVPDEVSVTEEVLVTDEIFVASDKIADNVIAGAEEQPAEEQAEIPRTREELIAEIETRLRELEEIHRAAADRVAQQTQEQQILIAGQMPEEPPVTGPVPSIEIEWQTDAPAESEAEAKPWQEELLELIPDEPVLEYEPAAQPVPDEPVEELAPAAQPVPDEPVLEYEPAAQPDPDEPEEAYQHAAQPVTDELAEVPEPATQLTPDEPPAEAEPATQLTPGEPVETPETDAQLTPADLIDRFIRTSPSIERLSPDDLQPVKDLSAESTEEHGKFITETLAKIYINQGYYSRAINIYEKLSIQYPEKSVYFASRIEKIKDLIK